MNTDRLDAIEFANKLLSLNPLFLDTETTGLDNQSEIIELCIIDNEDRVLFDSLIKPIAPIPPDSTHIHGITSAMVADSPNWITVWPKVESILRGSQICIYNADFDLRMIQQTHNRYGLLWKPSNSETNLHCMMKLFAQFRGDWDSRRKAYRWSSLDDAGKYAKVPLPNTHRALDDTRLARALLYYIASIKLKLE